MFIAAAAKIVFDRCVQKKKIEDKRGSYYVKVHYKYDFVEDFQELYEDQGPKITDDGSSTEQDSANISRGMSQFYYTLIVLHLSITFTILIV